uniref:J domain-containing protein n=1 Tax=Eutreptiella gymnastica TaxID=73025 RepID=A0A7S1IQW7_9EUGL|mmetsp:Transcript_36734/g.65710  ORF Transcript_36734/g.65710 Transcript_36734/m.65710 type:complete len:294 (+) Transcript_36734:38-919(+)
MLRSGLWTCVATPLRSWSTILAGSAWDAAGRRGVAGKNTNEPDFRSRDPFKVLGVRRQEEILIIKLQYYALSKMYHPDVTQGDDTMFKRLNKAYHQILDIRAGRDVEEEFDDSCESWVQTVKERNRRQRRSTANMRKEEYFMMRDWYIFTSSCRTENDERLFFRAFRLWATLNVFEVASAVRVGRFGVYVERLRLSFEAAMEQGAVWAHQRQDLMQDARQSMTEEDVTRVTELFEKQYNVHKVLHEAHVLFDKLRREEAGIEEDDQYDDEYAAYNADDDWFDRATQTQRKIEA